MDGVTILNVAEKGNWSFGLIIVLLLFLAVVILLIWLAGVLFIRDREYGSSVICFALILPLIFLGYAMIVDANGGTYNEYKVIVDESVSFTEFYDRYKIVDQEGKIYTVVERTND